MVRHNGLFRFGGCFRLRCRRRLSDCHVVDGYIIAHPVAFSLNAQGRYSYRRQCPWATQRQ